MNTEAPINQGHAYANSAEEYEDRELWSKAIESHKSAAEQFQLALDYTQDTEAGKTLRLLIATHTRKAKDLERKVIKLKAEQQQRMEARSYEQQQQHYHQRSMSNHIIGAGGLKGIDNAMNMNGLLNALPNELSPTGPSHLQTKMDKSKTYESFQHNTIGESYALLSADNDDDDDDDASDPFNKFLHAVEVLVDQLSNPVAFASAPLNEDDISTPYHQRLLSNDDTTTTTNFTLSPSNSNNHSHNKDKNIKDSQDPTIDNSMMMESFFLVPDHPTSDLNHLVTPSTTIKTAITSISPTSKSSSMQDNALKIENEQLKRHIDHLTRRIKSLEKSAEESHILKSSILQFRNDVQRQAKRIMQSHHGSVSMRSSSVALLGNSTIGNESISQNSFPRQQQSSVINQTNGSTAELVTRLKDLEEENRRLKDQVDKQQLLMNKYRERWEKLKESAKKRRAQPQDMANQSSEIPRQYSTRPPALLRSLAQQNSSAYPPFASTTSINNNYNNRSNRINTNDDAALM
ncbi:hypothetical protein BJ944DRAFT_290579 [Cunninghamella echinulata]|nr:hypothetical protein BJ944DRAFT_290579 [Cunninghamella echinulata]